MNYLFRMTSVIMVHILKLIVLSHLGVSDSLWLYSPLSSSVHGICDCKLLCPWDSPGENIGVGCRSLLQGIVPTQGLNPGVLPCRQILYHLSHQGSPSIKLDPQYVTYLDLTLGFMQNKEQADTTVRWLGLTNTIGSYWSVTWSSCRYQQTEPK